MFDALLKSEAFIIGVALALVFVTCVVLLVVLRAYLHLGKRLSDRHAARRLTDPVRALQEMPDLPATSASEDGFPRQSTTSRAR